MKAGSLSILFVGVAFAGCLGTDAGLDSVTPVDGLLDLTITRGDGSPARLALVEGLGADSATLWWSSTDVDGNLRTAVADDVAFLYVHGGPETIILEASNGFAQRSLPLGMPVPWPAFTPRVEFADPSFPAQVGTTCTEKTDGDAGCGLDEPTVIVDGNGKVYYSAVCCFLVSSPVWVSEDGGASFEPLTHPVKDRYGNEGDLWLDAEGNLYYMDIDLATFGFTRWNPDGSAGPSYRRPGEPLVDRPWIRATSGGALSAIYNTGSDTIVYRSTDYGMTFGATPVARFGSALAGAYADSRHDVVGMVGYGDYMESTDGGVTWAERTEVQGCREALETAHWTRMASVDEAGTVWFQVDSCVVGKRADGTWTQEMIAGFGEPEYAWIASGGPGAVATAYYSELSEAEAQLLGAPGEGWYVFVTFSADADAPAPHWATQLADPEPVGVGDLGRRLGDFLTVALGPDGAVHVAYARNPEMDDSATASYVTTGPILGMAPSVPLFGPFEDAPVGRSASPALTLI